MDGIDVALVETDGENLVRPRAFLTLAYETSFRASIARAVAAEHADAALERDLTRRHADAVRSLLAEANLSARDVALIGFHGHTAFHAPAQRRTIQIGDGALLARLQASP